MSVNVVALTGRLTKDVELRQTTTGTSVCNFTIAVDSGYGDEKKTDFINCVAWKSKADFLAKYFTKGQLIAIEGKITTRSWDGTDGKKNFVTEVLAKEVYFCGLKPEAQNNSSNTNTTPEVSGVPEGFISSFNDDDCPF